MRMQWTIGIVVMVGFLVIAQVTHAEIYYTPDLVATGFEHTYSVGGKATPITHIADSIQVGTAPSWTPDWEDPVTWVSTVTAPDGYLFVVTPPAGFEQSSLLCMASFWSTSMPVTDHTIFCSTTSYSFEDLMGTAPTLNGSGSTVGQALYTLSAQANFTVSEPFSFKSITFTTMPPYALGAFPVETYHGAPRFDFSVYGDGVLPDSTIISLQPIPEPASLWLLIAGGSALLMVRHRPRKNVG